MRFVLIRNAADYQDEITDIFKQLMNNSLKSEKRATSLVIYYNNYDNEEDITDMLYALENSFMFSVYAYLSGDGDEVRNEKEIAISQKLLDVLPPGVYNLKSAMFENPRITCQRDILAFILERSSINEEFIRGFAECDLNVSRASKEMFIHRNTMMYKLDKLKETSGFDLRNFKDAYILYMLVGGK